MNIESIKIYPSDSRLRSKYDEVGTVKDKRYSAQECEKNNGDRIYYSGSFTGTNVNQAAAETFDKFGHKLKDKIFRSGVFQSMLKMFEEDSVIASALVALFVAGGARPLTNIAMAGEKDKEDSMYAASHAIASAVIGFVVSSIIMAPFGTAFRKIKNDPKKYLTGLEDLLGVPEIGKRKLEKSKAYKRISKMAQFIPDSLVMGVPKAMLTIALIPPILKYVFHLEKGKKHNQTENNTNTQQVTPEDNKPSSKIEISENSPFKAFKGGVK